jgi:hypothetical protein
VRHREEDEHENDSNTHHDLLVSPGENAAILPERKIDVNEVLAVSARKITRRREIFRTPTPPVAPPWIHVRHEQPLFS